MLLSEEVPGLVRDRLPPQRHHGHPVPRESIRLCQAPRAAHVPAAPVPPSSSLVEPEVWDRGLGSGTRGWGLGPGIGVRDQGLGSRSGVTLPSLPQAFCQRFGAGTHLASVHSAEEHRAIVALLSSHPGEDSEEEEEDWDDGIWIGLHRPRGVSVAPGQSWDPPGTPETCSRQPRAGPVAPAGCHGVIPPNSPRRATAGSGRTARRWTTAPGTGSPASGGEPAPRCRMPPVSMAPPVAPGPRPPASPAIRVPSHQRPQPPASLATSIPGHQHPQSPASLVTSIPGHPRHRLTPRAPASSRLGQPSVAGGTWVCTHTWTCAHTHRHVHRHTHAVQARTCIHTGV